jgi:hypothetical protein
VQGEEKKTINRRLLTLIVANLVASGVADSKEHATPLYRDASQPVKKGIDGLLGRVTLEQKSVQMNMPCFYESGLGNSIPEKTESVRKFAAGILLENFAPGRGFFTLPNTNLHEGSRQQAEFLNRIHLYLEDVISAVTTPVVELRAFSKLTMDPGQSKTCKFRLKADDLAPYDMNLSALLSPATSVSWSVPLQ